MLVAALSTGNQIALAVVGGLFILFALASSFLFPRSNPNFPGKAMPWFILACVTFFVAMLAAVLLFGVEEKKAEGETAVATTSGGTPTLTTKTTGESEGGESGVPTKYAHGDAAAGKAIFTGSAGCGGCHTLKDAGSGGNVGPNLDEAKPDESLIVKRVTLGKAPMPSFKGQLTDKQIADVVAYVYSSTH
jgi:sulfite dehydrogenase